MELTEAINTRRTYRSFLDKEVEKEKEEALLSAAMRAPIAMGQYDNLKLVIYKGESAKKLQDDLVKYNKRDNTYGAPLLILLYHKLDNVDLRNLDSGAVIENICLKATELGLGTTFIYSIKPTVNNVEELKKYAVIEDKYLLTAMVSVGYIKDYTVRDIDHKFDVIYK